MGNKAYTVLRGVKVLFALRMSRAEKALALCIFLTFQALLPSYGAALAAFSDNDRLVVCSAHRLDVFSKDLGLIELGDPLSPMGQQETGSLCIQAQIAGVADHFAAPSPVMMGSPSFGVVVPHIVIKHAPPHSFKLYAHAPRAPPSWVFSILSRLKFISIAA